MSETKDKGSTLSECLADYCVMLHYCDLPDKVVGHAKLLLMDLMGASLAGSDTPEANYCLKAMNAFCSLNGSSSLWGTPYKHALPMPHYIMESSPTPGKLTISEA